MQESNYQKAIIILALLTIVSSVLVCLEILMTDGLTGLLLYLVTDCLPY